MIDTWRVRAAATGDARQAIRLLTQAETEYERARTGDDDPAWAYWMCRPSHMAETGRAFLDLTWIATAQARRRELDAAAETTTTAMDTAAMVESGRCTTLLSDLAGELEPHRAARPIGAILDRLDSDRC